MSEIRPALTADEWAALLKFGARIQASIGEDAPTALLYSPDPHGVAAAALHGQPFGFTWADVDIIRAALSRWDGLRTDDDGHAESMDYDFDRAYWSITERIAALLPPREET